MSDREKPLNEDDPRFLRDYVPLQSIATSSGQNDSGLFELNFRDERYLPFEGGGVVSHWRLVLPDEVRHFDYDTISDVILHLRYTAREGGDVLQGNAVENLKKRIEAAETVGSVRLLSVRHEFPTEWSKFKSASVSQQVFAGLTLTLREEHYPFWSQPYFKQDPNDNIQAGVKSVKLFAKTANDVKIADNANVNETGTKTDELKADPLFRNIRRGKLVNIARPKPIGEFTLYFNDTSMEDLWLALTWGKGA
jgi:hypothetical protein